MMSTVLKLGAELAAGRTTSRALVEQCLTKIAEPSGEGSRVFMKVYEEMALAEADASDKLRANGIVRSPMRASHIGERPFDVSGDVTLAGSKALKDSPPARADAPAVARLRAAGAVVLGRTAMVEFAFGGIGTNPHYGTPKNPFGRTDGRAIKGRIPGGSSSGAGVAVADGMCVMGLGSVACCRCASLRRCAASPASNRRPRVSTAPAPPLSYTLDSVGPLANSVALRVFDAILSGEGRASEARPPPARRSRLRLLVPECFAMADLDDAVDAASAPSRRSRTRAATSSAATPPPPSTPPMRSTRRLRGPRVGADHRPILASHRAEYDPNVAARIEAGENAAADYVH